MQSKLYIIPRHLYETYPNVFANGNIYIITGTPDSLSFHFSNLTEAYKNKLKDDGYKEKFKIYLSEYLFNYCGHEIEVKIYN